MMERAPVSLRQALLSEGDELVSVQGPAERETFHLSRRRLDDGQTLIAVRSVTQEINRHEVASLKKVIRIISHEINNSLGPIASLVGSAKLILQRPEHLPKLPSMFDTIQERTLHLQRLSRGIRQARQDPSAATGVDTLASFPRRAVRVLARTTNRPTRRSGPGSSIGPRFSRFSSTS